MEDFSQYKTDEERLRVAHSVPYIMWDIVADWSDEAKDPKTKSILHDIAVRKYRLEEASCGML